MESFKEKFISIEYPGYVKNISNAIGSLGGEASLSKITENEAKFMELRFRPQDPYCHSIYGERTDTAKLLMKVVCKRKRSDPNQVTNFAAEIVGIIPTTYKFQGLADFQYVTSAPAAQKLQDVCDSLEDNSTTVAEEPMNLPPPIFSKIDVPQKYAFRTNPYFKFADTDDGEPKIVKRPKKSYAQIVFMNYDQETSVPSEPHIANEAKQSDDGSEARLAEMFQKRPLWSLTALKASLQEPGDVKNLHRNLPRVAYYFRNGPWRKLWVRFGYDPRKSPESKIWQVLDLRMRDQYGKAPKPLSRTPRRIKNQAKNSSTQVQGEDLSYTFTVPPSRNQTLYQLCDLKDKKIQKLVNQNEKPVCDVGTGWLTKLTLHKIQDLMKQKIPKLLQGTEEEHESEDDLEEPQASQSVDVSTLQEEQSAAIPQETVDWAELEPFELLDDELSDEEDDEEQDIEPENEDEVPEGEDFIKDISFV